jgi:hypothetical protein
LLRSSIVPVTLPDTVQFTVSGPMTTATVLRPAAMRLTPAARARCTAGAVAANGDDCPPPAMPSEPPITPPCIETTPARVTDP